MAQHYSDPRRESDPYALPDIETFQLRMAEQHLEAGWYWQACFPGCLPDGDPVGPFATEAEALADAREGYDTAADGEGEEA